MPHKRLKSTLKTSPLGAWPGAGRNSKFWKGLVASLSVLDRPVFPPADFLVVRKLMSFISAEP